MGRTDDPQAGLIIKIGSRRWPRGSERITNTIMMTEGKKGQKTHVALKLTMMATQPGVGSELQTQIAPE